MNNRSGDVRTRARLMLTAASVLMLLSFTRAAAQDDMRQFITRSGDRLMEGTKEYRFISFNIPNLHLVEDNMAFEATSEWRFPEEFEIADALMSVRRMGGRVARTYVLSVCKKDGPNPIPCHVRAPGEFNEEAFRALDKVLETANRLGVRVVIPLVDNWKWWGGVEQYAEHRGKPAGAFWTDPEIISDFKKTISFLLNRRNTYTGTLYKDDRAVLAWETGNELYSPYSWTREIAAHIKSLDSNHLVWDGFYIGNREIQTEALSDPNIDIVSSHHYPDPNKNILEDIERFQRQIAGKKVYVLGEFGFVPLSEIRKILDAVIQKGVSGALVWSLRFHNRDGGFYWHSEPSGGALYKAYHYPGFITGAAYEERGLMALMREKAYEIRGLQRSPILEVPAPPVLLPVKSVAEISWQGSAGAEAYDVERAAKLKGPWTTVGASVDDTWAQYRPLFSDVSAAAGQTYYYRVRAKNSIGASQPSNVVGPVRVEDYTIVDELTDFSHTHEHGGDVALETGDARAYKEDAHRLRAGVEGWVTYRAPAPLRSARVLVFTESVGKDAEFYVSQDGASFVRVEPKVNRFPTTVNPYGYKLPVRYELADLQPGSRFLKIILRTGAQLSRVELRHGR
jgi:mannan endo-1,4-beta-mannosidase